MHFSEDIPFVTRRISIQHIRQIWSRAALVIAHFKDHFQKPRVFRPCSIHGHAETMLKSIPEEELKQYFEQWKHGLTQAVAEQADYF
jgi:hypothetical protein